MKVKLLITALIFTVLPGLSQSWEAVKNSRDYFYGEGRGITIAEADREAIQDLISKISLQASYVVNVNEIELKKGDELDGRRKFEVLLNTYSQATLNNTEKVILQNEPDAHVGRWILRAEVEKIFANRVEKVKDYVRSALKAESQGKIDVALKDFYWALALLRSTQHPGVVKYEPEEGESVILMNWIPNKINDIFSELHTEITKRNGDEVELLISYKGRPVNSIDYSFFDGRDWSNIYSAKDGVGVLELAPGNMSENYQLRFEYEFASEAHIDKEVESVLNAMAGVPMRNAYTSLKSRPADVALAKTSKEIAGPMKTCNSFSKVPAAIFRKPDEYHAPAEMRARLDEVIAAVKSKNYSGVQSLFTPNGLEVYRGLLDYGRAKIVGTPDVKFYKAGNDIIARGLQMSFSFSTGMRRSFVEDVVFSFNADGKIDNITFGLGKTAEDDILGKGVWDENARFTIMNFMENYKTAYALKRLDYISTIFDDDAVIITGSVVKRPATRVKNGEISGLSFNNDIIKYNRHTKDSYLKYLKKSFVSKEFINLRFADNEVRKLGKGGELYAIQISQEYYSSNYGDKGYLFLMVDINDPENPIIKVRTWQPEKDPNFGLYGPEHFK